MSIELYINNFRIPLASLSITINKQTNNLAELKDRQATYTNKFKAYKTPGIIKFLNNLGVVGNVSRSPYEILYSKLLFNGIEIVSGGNAYITSSNNLYYDIVIYDDNIFLFQEIGSKKINELDLSEYQHQLTVSNYKSSFTNTDGYIYAISDNGKINPSKIEINYQLPSIFVSTLWQKIFNETSYSYIGDVFSSYKFKNLVLTPKRGYNNEIDSVSNPIDINDTSLNTINSYFGDLIYDQSEPYYQDASIYEEVWSWSSQMAEYTNTSNFNNGILNITESGQYTIQFEVNISNMIEESYKKIELTIRNEQVIYYIDNVINTTTTETLIVNIVLNLSQEDYLTFHIKIIGEEELRNIPTHTINIQTTLHIFSVNNSVIDLSLNSFIGDLSQAEFVKAIMQHFGLMFQPVKNTKIYEFKRIQDILLNTQNSTNWSDKYVSTSKEVYGLKGYARKNRMGYRYFDANSDKFADGFLIVDNKNLKAEKNSFTSPFNACETSDILINNDILTYTPFWKDIRNDNGVVEKYKPTNNKNYLAEVKRVYEKINYGLTNGQTLNHIGLIPRLNFRNLNYNKIISENYSRLKVILDWNNVRQIKVRLTAREVSNFNFFNLIYIDKLSSLFYVNKISYKGKSTSNVEIVQVLKIPYECDLVANSGSYPVISKDLLTIQLNGNSSQGNITTWLWEIVGETINNAVISNENESIAILSGLNVIGNYEIRLTISNTYCTKTSNVIIKVI